MGIENMGLDLAEQEKLRVTLPGQPGYRAAWDKATESETPQATKDSIRDSAIDGADFEELNAALDRLENRHANTESVASAEELAALARMRGRIDSLIQRNQN